MGLPGLGRSYERTTIGCIGLNARDKMGGQGRKMIVFTKLAPLPKYTLGAWYELEIAQRMQSLSGLDDEELTLILDIKTESMYYDTK